METMVIDGAQGEGGGQILRSALTLSMITGVPFRIEGIRAGRSKPGLLRQHLTAVAAAAEICNAQVSGNVAGSPMLEFIPGAIKGDDYRFDIGTAGSCTLVLQTVLPALWFANGASSVAVSGGTHNSGAPPADFLVRSWLPLMQRMGVEMDITLLRHGFYPAGGGEIHAAIQPVKKLQPLHLDQRGGLEATKMIAVVAGIPADVARRELAHLEAQLGDAEQEMRVLDSREGPGNVVMVEFRHAHLTEIFVAFGERGVKAEVVAERVATEALSYRGHDAIVGEHLADQLVLPMALAGAGSFTATVASPHLQTNCQVIQKFLPIDIEVSQAGKAHLVRVN